MFLSNDFLRKDLISVLKKRLTAFITAFGMVCALFQGVTLNVSAADTYIGTLAELEAFREEVNSGNDFAGETVYLTADIDMSDSYGADIGGLEVSWMPIGNNTNKFAGNFDGGGFSVTGIYINTNSSTYRGLFGYVTGTVSNLTLDGSVTGRDYTGGICGKLDGGKIENCVNNASVNGTKYVGGIVGQGAGTAEISDCSNTAAVTATGGTGGIMGSGKAQINRCFNTGDISSVSGASIIDGAGGICGTLNANSVAAECYNRGSITISGSTKTASDGLGGVIGVCRGKIHDCYNVGTISTADEYVYTGGVIGSADMATAGVSNCYNTGTVENTAGGTAAGVYANSVVDVTNCYFLSVSYGDGGLSATELADKNSYTDWDFTDVWEMNMSFGRPFLRSIPENKGGLFQGNGTEEQPYLIPDLDMFDKLGESVAAGTSYAGKYFTLLSDIDMRGHSWSPIGTETDPFDGIFDGLGFTIENLNISDADTAGLFGYVTGEVKNLTVEGSLDGETAGGIAAVVDGGTISDCTNNAVINGAVAGGIAGEARNASTLSRCHNSAAVSGSNLAGGIVAFGDVNISDSYNTGKIDCTGSKTVSDYAGGLIARIDGGSVVRSFNKGSVGLTGSGASAKDALGGIAGYNGGSIEDCYNVAPVVSAENDIETGGVTGHNAAAVKRCYNIGSVEAVSADTGAFSGVNSGSVSDSFYLDSIGTDNSGATPLAKADFADTTIFSAWNFDDVWVLDSNFGRPMLKEIPEDVLAIFLGDGTEANPYIISDLPDLEAFRDSVNSGNSYAGSFFSITDDIDMSQKYGEDKQQSWTAIGKYTSDSNKQTFEGTLNGGGHTISGLYLSNSAYQQGLFGCNEGVIDHLIVTGDVSARTYVGGIAGYNRGTIRDCRSDVNVTGSERSAGGVAGWNSNIIERCFSTGEIDGATIAGGVAGNNDGTIKDCYNTGAVNGNSDVGGVVGQNSSVLKNCYNIGSVASGGSGVAGTSSSNSVTSCFYLDTSATGGVGGVDTPGSASALTLTDFERQALFANWDLIETWGMSAPLGRLVLISIPEGEIRAFKGAGTEASPYLIPDAITFKVFCDYINENSSGHEYFLLTGDIDLSTEFGAEVSWTPIGTDKFNGVLDGDGHTISNLYIDTNSDNMGLFKGIGPNGEIRRLHISIDAHGGDYTGSIAPDNEGLIEECFVSGTMYGTGSVGAIVAKNSGTIKNCYNKADITAAVSGGITAKNSGTIENCYSIGNAISGTASENNGTITACYYLKDTADSGIGTDNANGSSTEITQARMSDPSAFDGWDFRDVWKMSNTIFRPVLNRVSEDSLGMLFEGAGTEADPYRIKNLDNLALLSRYVNAGNGAGEYFILMNDIDMSGEYGPDSASWPPIGTRSSGFRGNFDGNGHTIKGLYVSSDEDYCGLFGYISRGSNIKNISVSGTVTGGNYTGAIAGQSYGTIENAASSVTVTGSDNTGGIVGANGGNMSSCYNIGSVTGEDNTGGIAGASNGNISNCCYDEAVYTGENTISGVYDLPRSAFESGEAAYLLCTDQTGDFIWGQGLIDNKDLLPVLTKDSGKRVYKVRFMVYGEEVSVSYTNYGGKITPPSVSGIDGVIFEKWSLTNSRTGEEFTADTVITKDTTVYGVGLRRGSASVVMDNYTCGDSTAKPNPRSSTNGTNNVKYEYTKKGEDNYTENQPITAGEYTLRATFAETDDYTKVIVTVDFTVSHDFSGELKYDKNNHWHECKCGETDTATAHTYEYSADENVITERCAEDCGIVNTATLTVTDGQAKVVYSDDWGAGELEIVYRNMDGIVVSGTYEAGTYTASITVGQVTATQQFEVTTPSTPPPTATPIPTETPIPTDTPIPTETPIPTGTPVPTETPIPTDTPIPTGSGSMSTGATSAASSKATPKPAVKPTPVPEATPQASEAPQTTESPLNPHPVQNVPYIHGYSEGDTLLFKPLNNMTRAEAAKIIVINDDEFDPEAQYASTAKDIDPDSWYSNYMNYAIQKGYIKGYDDGLTKPDSTITRAEFASILAKYLELETSENKVNNNFEDVAIGSWYYDCINALADHGTVSGYEGKFRPDAMLNRAEAVAIINRSIGRVPTDEIKKLKCPFADVSIDYWGYNDILLAACEF